MSKELVITDELKGLEKSKAAQIEAVFAPMVEMLKGFEKAYEAVLKLDPSEETSKEAKKLRIAISKVRIEADKIRIEQKAEYTRGGNAVQGVYNILKFAVADKEEHLKEIETHFERLEAEKVKTLQAERELELVKYEVDGSVTDLGNMDNPIWINYLSGVKLNFQAVKDAEEKAEKERIEAERKSKQFDERWKDLLIYSDYIDIDKLCHETTEEEFTELLNSGKTAKSKHEAAQEKIRIENEALKKEREDAEKKRVALEKENEAILVNERKKKDRIIKEQEEKRIKDEADQKAKEKKEADELELKKKANVKQYSKILLASGYESNNTGVYVMGFYRVTDSQLETLTDKEFNQRLEEASKNHKRDLELAERNAEDARLKKEKDISDKKALEAGDPEKLKILLSHFDELKGGKLKSEIAQKAIKESYTILQKAISELSE